MRRTPLRGVRRARKSGSSSSLFYPLFAAAGVLFLIVNLLLAQRSEHIVHAAQRSHIDAVTPAPPPPPPLLTLSDAPSLDRPTLRTAAHPLLAQAQPTLSPPNPASAAPAAPSRAAPAAAAAAASEDVHLPLGGGPGLPMSDFPPFYLAIPFLPEGTVPDPQGRIALVQRETFFTDCPQCDHGKVHNATHRRFEGQNYENGGAVLYPSMKMVARGQSAECGWKAALHPPQYEAAAHSAIGPPTIPKVALVLVPFCGVYQHFIDGVLPKIAQSWPIIKDYPILFDFMKKTEKGVREVMEDILGMTLVTEPQYDAWVAAGTVVESFAHVCRAPGIHPALWRRARAIVLSQARLDQLPPLSGAAAFTTAAYFVRNTKMATNGRQIANEAQLITALQGLFGEKLLLISYDPTQHVRDQMHLVSTKKLLIGGHGGALYNHYWAPLGATVIEIAQRSSHPNMKDIFWKSISAMGQKYVRIPPQGSSVDINLVVAVVKGLPDFNALLR